MWLSHAEGALVMESGPGGFSCRFLASIIEFFELIALEAPRWVLTLFEQGCQVAI